MRGVESPTIMQFNRGNEERVGLTFPYKIHQSPPMSPTAGNSGHVFQQSVTLHAYMEGYPRNTDETVTDTGWFIWGITQSQLPILVGAAAGGLVLLLTLASLLIWRFYQQRRDKEKEYCLQSCNNERDCRHTNSSSLKRTSNDAVIFIGTLKPGHSGQSSDGAEASSNGISRSHSAPLKGKETTHSTVKSVTPKKRPQSQPIGYSTADITLSPHLYYNHHVTPHHYNAEGHLPDIPEMRLHSSDTLDSESLASSYGTYDPAFNKLQIQLDPNSASLKTRSLPTWARSRPRPLSTEDDLNELYAKVNFNRKRKNRMRNDSAAAIALNKSRSQFIHFPFMHKDTDSLVDNEAVVVYDERTAL